MKRLIDKAFILKRIPLFAMLDLDLLLTIADKLTSASVDRGESIFSIDQDAHKMYFIAQGSVRIRDRNQNTLALLGPNDFFGEESLFQDKPRGYEALSETDTEILAITRTHLLTIISECPSVAVGFLQAYSANGNYRVKKMVEAEE